jgi:hypothetical protein
MGIFNFSKKKQSTKQHEQPASSAVIIQGPRYLRSYLIDPDADVTDKFKIEAPHIEWVGQLASSTQNRQFAIHYYGSLINKEVIVADKDIVQKVVAVDVYTNEKILLFDKTLHGWGGFITDAYEEYKSLERPANKVYVSKYDTVKFKILFVAYYNASTKEELQEEATVSGMVEVNGAMLPLQDAFDDAFDALVIYAIDEKGNRFEIINEELA